jgi:YbbR domain-containing protein
MYSTEMLERGFLVPVEYVVPSKDIALVGDKPTEVKLLLSGPKADLDRIRLSQLAVRIDLSDAMPGKQAIPVTDENVKLPRSIKLVGVDPPNFVLNVQQVFETEATVVPQIIGKVVKGLKVVSVDVNPATVRVLCPTDKSKQRKLNVMTTPIYLESIKEDSKLFCKIIAPAGIRPVESRWPDIEVSIALSSQE